MHDNYEPEENKKLYAETRRDLLARQMSNSEKFDSAILTLSTASLGVALTLIKDIVPIHKAEYILALQWSWWFFGLAILATIFSFLASQKSIKNQLFYAEKYYLDREDLYLNAKNYWAIATDSLNILAAIGFISGLLLTIIFVSENLGSKDHMTDEHKSRFSTQAQFNDGAPIPKMQKVSGSNDRGMPIPHMQPISSDTQPNKDGASAANGQSNVPKSSTKNNENNQAK